MGRLLKTTIGKAELAIFSFLAAITAFVAVEVTYGHFANHPSWSQCYEGWPYNTRIQTPQAVAMHNPGGTTMYYTYFYLKDRGDPNCSMPSYWVDLYFGRSRLYGQPCNCPGSPSPGDCVDGQINNCNDAINFGTKTWTYVYTFP
jgi:hypothetical protein